MAKGETAKVSDSDLVTGKELRLVCCQLRFESLEEVDPLSLEDLSVNLCLLCFATHEGLEEGSAIGRHALSPSVDNPINLPSSLPVRGVIIAELDTKHAKSGTDLLVTLALIEEVGQDGHFTLVCAASQLPFGEAKVDLGVRLLGSVQANHERFSAPEESVEVLNGVDVSDRCGGGAAHLINKLYKGYTI